MADSEAERPDPAEGDDEPFTRTEYRILSGAAYVVLAIAGAMLGLVGSFQFPWSFGGVPVLAIVLSVVNLAAFWFAGRAMTSKLGATIPAAAWLFVVVVLSMRRPEGDLIVTGTTAGYVYIFGGSLAAAVAIVVTRSDRPWMLRGLPPGDEPHDHQARS